MPLSLRAAALALALAAAPTAAAQQDALMEAVSDQDLTAVDAALAAGAEATTLHLVVSADGPIRRDGDDRTTQATDAQVVARLLAAGLAPDATLDVGGEALTPLAIAAGLGRAPVVRVLLDAGASATAPLASGDHPIHAAARGGDAETVQMLLAAGADPEARGALGRTPLMAAATRNEAAAIGVLLAAGADPTRRTPTDSTALDFATVPNWDLPGTEGQGRAAARRLQRALGERSDDAVWTDPAAPPCDAVRAYVTEVPALQYGDEAVYAPAFRTATYALTETPLAGAGVVREDGTMVGTLWTRTLALPSLDVPARADWAAHETELATALAAEVAACLGDGYAAAEAVHDPEAGNAAAEITGPEGLEAMRVVVVGADRSELFMRYSRYEISQDDLTEPTPPATLRPELYVKTLASFHGYDTF